MLRHRVAPWLELGCVDEGLSLLNRVHISDADELAEIAAMLAPHLDPVRSEHWVQRALDEA